MRRLDDAFTADGVSGRSFETNKHIIRSAISRNKHAFANFYFNDSLSILHMKPNPKLTKSHENNTSFYQVHEIAS